MNLKTKIRILSIILIAAVFSLIIFLIFPLFEDIKKSSSDILEQKQKLLLLESRVQDFEKFKNRYIEIEPDFKKTETLFIKADLPVDFIRFLEKTAKDSNVIAKISLSPAQPPSFQIALEGSFPNFLGFLEKLQSGQYLIDVQDISASSGSASISFLVLAK